MCLAQATADKLLVEEVIVRAQVQHSIKKDMINRKTILSTVNYIEIT